MHFRENRSDKFRNTEEEHVAVMRVRSTNIPSSRVERKLVETRQNVQENAPSRVGQSNRKYSGSE